MNGKRIGLWVGIAAAVTAGAAVAAKWTRSRKACQCEGEEDPCLQNITFDDEELEEETCPAHFEEAEPDDDGEEDPL
jgi:hypothetical protein